MSKKNKRDYEEINDLDVKIDDNEDREPNETELREAEEDVLEEESARREFNYNVKYGPLFSYLNATADTPLLTHEEEIELGKKVKHGNEHERAEAINELVMRNLRLVVFNAKQCKFPKVELEDLIQEGVIGLMKAASKYDYSKSFKFATYATWWIKQAINRKGHDMSRTIRIPAHIITKRNRVNRALKMLEQEGVSAPTYEQIQEACEGELTLAQIKTIMEDIEDAVSLDVSVDNNEDGSSSLLDFINFGQSNNIEESIKESERYRALRTLMEVLTPRERMIVTMRNGLFGEVPMDVRQLSEVYGITRERIRQIYNASIRKMSKKVKVDQEEYFF